MLWYRKCSALLLGSFSVEGLVFRKYLRIIALVVDQKVSKNSSLKIDEIPQ
jgi:hypothetical protein